MAHWPTTTTWNSVDCMDEGRTWLARAGQWLASSRAHRVICLVAGIWILNAFDLILTISANKLGVLHEQNPVAVRFLEDGTLSIMLYKIGMVLLGSYPLLRFRTARIAELGAMVIVVVYAMLAVRWSACYDVYTMTVNSGYFMAEVRASGG